MRDSRIEEPLSDAAFEREIEHLLHVEPPLGFASRVRARVARETRPRVSRSQWATLAAGAAVISVLSGTWYLGTVPGNGPAGVRRTAAPAPVTAGAADEGGREARSSGGDAGRLSRTGPGGRSARRPLDLGLEALAFTPVSAQPLVLPEVLISQDEQRALALLQHGPSKETAETDVEPRIPALSPLAAIDIPDVEVAPLKQIAALELQGDRP